MTGNMLAPLDMQRSGPGRIRGPRLKLADALNQEAKKHLSDLGAITLPEAIVVVAVNVM